ncbi:MAG: hypothetical protein QF371_04680, partial [Flavobacteriales bacterium]|nr:hypothetical protein [Flavobacteriales bacterium]
MNTSKNHLFNFILLAIGLVPLLHWMFGHLHQDGWWDELISLKDYALVGFQTTMTSYPEPGNHILFNLFDNVLSRLLGVRDFYEMLDHLWKLRLAQGILSIGTCIYSYLIVPEKPGRYPIRVEVPIGGRVVKASDVPVLDVA